MSYALKAVAYALAFLMAAVLVVGVVLLGLNALMVLGAISEKLLGYLP